MGGERANSLNASIEISSKNGYILYKDLDDIANIHNLSLGDLDWLCNELSLKGILVYDKAPLTNEEFSDEDFDDRSHLDYSQIFNNIKEKSPSLAPFADNVSKIIPPQYGEISRLKYQIIEGNEYARRRMIEMHLRIALKHALQRSEQYNHDIIELVEIACWGLVTAIDKYNPNENGSFQSYASLWILQHFSRYQPIKRALIKYSAQKRNAYFDIYPFLNKKGCLECSNLSKCNKIREEIYNEKIVEDYSFIDDAINESIPDELFSQIFDNDYLDDEKWDEELAKIAQTSICTLDESFEYLINQELHSFLWIVMSILTQKEKYVVLARNGFFKDGEEMTLDAIGNKFGITRERVRQIEKRTYEKLRKELRRFRIFSADDYFLC